MNAHPPGGPHEPHPDQGPAGPEDVGTVAEEAAKLLGALSGWAKDQSGEWGHGWAGGVSDLADHAAATARQVHDHLDEGIATDSPECRYCPVCRTIHLVREMSPEVRTHLTGAASSLLQAAAAVMATQAPRGGARPGVEHIDLDDPDADDPDADGDGADGDGADEDGADGSTDGQPTTQPHHRSDHQNDPPAGPRRPSTDPETDA